MIAARSTLSVACLLGLVSSFCALPLLRPVSTKVSRSDAKTILNAVDTTSTSTSRSIVVVSPPGGIGEVTAVRAAELGAAVRWFVVSSTSSAPGSASSSQSTSVLRISPDAIERIASAGGSIQLAGSNSLSLLMPTDEDQDGRSALSAVSAWCGPADTIACTFDGIDPDDLSTKSKRNVDDEERRAAWKNAVKLAAREAAKQVKGARIAVLSASDSDSIDSSTQNDMIDEGILGRVGNMLKGRTEIPSTIVGAIGNNMDNLIILRHGQVFGTPESSPDFSALVGGPRRIPELCEEYSNRAIRVDPTLTVAGNYMMGQTTRSSRHAVGEAAALISLNLVPLQAQLDVCVSSQLGTDPVTLDDWKSEFQRVATMVATGQEAQLFATDFASVPDTERLADWIAMKWAPAILRTYDIAAIRTGARPVSANRDGLGKVEIIWQQLVNFNTVTVGRMFIQITESGLVATRGPGDPSAGFGSVSRQPLAGEDVLVRRLAEASSQAIEKGLAVKPKITKAVATEKVIPVMQVAAPLVSSLQSSSIASEESEASITNVPENTGESGPRQAGARRSTEKMRKKS